VAKLGALDNDPIVRRAIIEASVRNFAWEMLEIFDDQTNMRLPINSTS